jgi:hypothetical protein
MVILQEKRTLKGMFDQCPVIILFMGGRPKLSSRDPRFPAAQWKLPLKKNVFVTGIMFFQPKPLQPELSISIDAFI